MSLLLDALKKAAEEKLANKDKDNDVANTTVVDATEVAEPTAINADVTESTLVDQDQTQIAYDSETDYDATMVDYTGMPAESTIADNSDQDLTSFDFEPVDKTGLEFSDTEVGITKTSKEPTELEAITDLSPHATDFNQDISVEQTVIGAQDDHAIDVDETGIDVTQVNQQDAYQTEAKQYQDTALHKTSLTDNFLKRGYDASPQAAANIVGSGMPDRQSKGRLFVLLGLVVLLGLGVLSLFAYQYYQDSKDVDYKLSYQQYKTKRSIEPRDKQTDKTAPATTNDTQEFKDEIVVQREDYVNLLDKEFNTIADQSTRAQNISQQPKANNKRVSKPKAAATKVIKIRKTRQEPVSAVVLRGYNAFNDGDIEAAKQHYQAALSRQNNNRDARLGMAAIAVTEEQTSVARNIYVDLLKENPSDPAALAGLTALGPTTADADKQATLSSIKMMLEQQPNAANLHFALGNLYADESRWPEAQKAFFNAYSLDSGNPDYLYNLAVSLDYMGKQQAALPFYQQALVQSGLRQNNIPIVAAEQRISTIQNQK